MRRYLILLVLGWLVSTQVLAHSMLRASTPLEGAEVSAPEALTLTFSEPVRLLRLMLKGPDGTQVPLGFEAAREPAAQVRYALPSLPPGPYTVEWTLIGDDGHTVSEQFSFSVTDSRP